jgi:type IV secretory pathway TrbF-like protein
LPLTGVAETHQRGAVEVVPFTVCQDTPPRTFTRGLAVPAAVWLLAQPRTLLLSRFVALLRTLAPDPPVGRRQWMVTTLLPRAQ